MLGAEYQRERGGPELQKSAKVYPLRTAMFFLDISLTHSSGSQFCRFSEEMFGRSSTLTRYRKQQANIQVSAAKVSLRGDPIRPASKVVVAVALLTTSQARSARS
jgi:hypothetical protein